MTDEAERDFSEIVRRDGRYPLEAFAFLHEALDRAQKQVYGDADAEQDQQRHVSGQQLCQALRDQAIERWGLLARTVLAKWNIHETIDFGHMVELLVEVGILSKTEEDSLEDFRDVYDFDEAFGSGEVFQG